MMSLGSLHIGSGALPTHPPAEIIKPRIAARPVKQPCIVDQHEHPEIGMTTRERGECLLEIRFRTFRTFSVQ